MLALGVRTRSARTPPSRSKRASFGSVHLSPLMSTPPGRTSTGKPQFPTCQSFADNLRGCVTPAQVENMIDSSGGDTDMVDGYGTLPPEMQEKVKFALENGHVPDEDWKGVSIATATCIPSSANNLQDVEVNRPGKKGFRYKAPKEKATKKKKKADKADEEDDGEESSKPKPKRGRAAKDDDGEEDAPAPKKAKGRAKKVDAKDEHVADAEEDEPKPSKAKGRGKKAVVEAESDKAHEAEPETKAEEEAEDGEPKPKKAAKGKKAAVKKEAAPRPASSRAQRTTSKAAPVYNDDATNGDDDDEKPAPQKR